MIDADPRPEVIVPQGLKNLINVNTEYHKVICNGSGCGYAKELNSKKWIKHLQKHKVPNKLVVEASSFIKELGWDRLLISRQTTPLHGLAPQPGIKVIDGGSMHVLLDVYVDEYDGSQDALGVGRAWRQRCVFG